MNRQNLLTLLALKCITSEDKTNSEILKLLSSNRDTTIQLLNKLEEEQIITISKLNGYVNRYKIIKDIDLDPPFFLSLPINKVIKEYLCLIYLNYEEFNSMKRDSHRMKLIGCTSYNMYKKLKEEVETYGEITQKLFTPYYIMREIPNTVRDETGFLKYIYHNTTECLCKMCGQTESTYFSEYNKSYCKECFKGIKDNKIINISKFFKLKIHHIKKSAKSRNLEFDLTVDDLVSQYLKQNQRCAYSHKEFIMGDGDYSLSIDRIDSTKGYVKENIQFIWFIYNRMKGQFSTKKFMDIMKSIQ